MSDYNRAIDDAVEIIEAHAAAHKASTKTIATREDTAEIVTAVARDIEALAVKVRRLKR